MGYAPAAARCRAASPIACAPPVKPITFIPAAHPAVTPKAESSITTQSSGATAIVLAANR